VVVTSVPLLSIAGVSDSRLRLAIWKKSPSPPLFALFLLI